MEKNKLKVLVKVLLALLVLTLVTCVVKTIVDCINTCNNITASFPWYAPIVLNGIIFAIPFALELLLFAYFYVRSKK